MEPAKSFKDLIVWQKGHRLVLDIYKYTDKFPGKETYCLVPQLRRAVISVPANIAEGFKKKGKADKIRFLNIAQGSLEEVRYYLILAADLGYGKSDELISDLDIVSKLLEGYMASIRKSM
jgi:four helix bundle protein